MDPSISVKRKVTVPVGRLFKSGLLGTSGAASNQSTRSAVTVFPPRTQRELASGDLAEDQYRYRMRAIVINSIPTTAYATVSARATCGMRNGRV